MDNKSLRILEYHKVLDILVGYTSFTAGEALAHKLQPTTDPILAKQWQRETAETLLLLDTHPNITIGGARDVRRAADNAQHGFTLPAETLLDIRSTLIAARTLKRQLIKVVDEFPTLAAIAELIEECPGLVDTISNTLDERGDVLDSASSKLAKIRSDLRTVYGRIQDKLQRLLSSNKNQWLQEPIITMRSGRYVVPVKADAKGRIKGIVHDQSGSGATVWVEPMATVDLNNDFRGLQMSEQAETERILADLSANVAEQGDAIIRIVERMAELDLIFARAKYAAIIKGVPPQFAEWREFEQPKPPKHANERAKWTPPPPNLHPGSTIWMRGARHPLLPPNDVIPTDLTLDEKTFTVLITGPNTGGKTVSLKTVGLMVLMAQSGLHLPVIEARLTVFEDVFADIGDEQSIEQSLSTFSAHMSNIIHILSQIDDRSLVLLDELGSGTDPTEGAALAQSITNFMRDKGATTFVATHYPELKLYADQQPGATNASLMFDIETLSPTYEMAIGIPGKSNAFAIARQLGLDETILDEAMLLTGAGSNEAESMLDAIYDLRDKIASEEAAARLIRRQLEDEKDVLARQLEQLEEEREAVLEEAQEEARQKIAAIEDELRQARRQIRDAHSLNKLKKVSKDVAALELDAVEKIAPKTAVRHKKNRLELQVGDKVLVKALNTEGEVVSLSKYEAMIVVGRLQMRTKLRDLEFKSRPEDEEAELESIPIIKTASPGVELDIRGRRVEEGLSALTTFIDQAYLSQMPWVRIIHGKGTGRLRTAVRKALKKNKQAASFEEGKDGEGGAGVTVVKF
ncbi:Recombination inhibitory protein MutS2 [hydrothermal vent metagenome]|uniref:Recombination inhibitory protein MutS2 n=1 Tax=hydrothermal vent metagenome TaxID=652676 RepID=A0A3B0UJG1_9ZZZZ